MGAFSCAVEQSFNRSEDVLAKSSFKSSGGPQGPPAAARVYPREQPAASHVYELADDWQKPHHVAVDGKHVYAPGFTRSALRRYFFMPRRLGEQLACGLQMVRLSWQHSGSWNANDTDDELSSELNESQYAVVREVERVITSSDDSMNSQIFGDNSDEDKNYILEKGCSGNIQVVKQDVTLPIHIHVEDEDIVHESRHGSLFPNTVRCIIAGPSGRGKTCEYFSTGRQTYVDCMYPGQTYSVSIPKQILCDNANVLVLFRMDWTNLPHVYDDHVNTDMTLSDFKDMCSLCWKDKYGFLTIAKDCLLHKGRYRRGFDHFIEVCREGSSTGNQQVMSSIPPATSISTVSSDDYEAAVNAKDEMSAVQSVCTEALNADEHKTPATKKSKLVVEGETGSEVNDKDSFDDDYDGSDNVEYNDDSLDIPTYFRNKFPVISDVKKAEDAANTDYMFTEDPSKFVDTLEYLFYFHKHGDLSKMMVAYQDSRHLSRWWSPTKMVVTYQDGGLQYRINKCRIKIQDSGMSIATRVMKTYQYAVPFDGEQGADGQCVCSAGLQMQHCAALPADFPSPRNHPTGSHFSLQLAIDRKLYDAYSLVRAVVTTTEFESPSRAPTSATAESCATLLPSHSVLLIFFVNEYQICGVRTSWIWSLSKTTLMVTLHEADIDFTETHDKMRNTLSHRPLIRRRLGSILSPIKDNICLVWLHSMKEARSKLTRVALLLQSYDFTVEHIPGQEKQLADTLSCVSDASAVVIDDSEWDEVLPPDPHELFHEVLVNKVQTVGSDLEKLGNWQGDTCGSSIGIGFFRHSVGCTIDFFGWATYSSAVIDDFVKASLLLLCQYMPTATMIGDMRPTIFRMLSMLLLNVKNPNRSLIGEHWKIIEAENFGCECYRQFVSFIKTSMQLLRQDFRKVNEARRHEENACVRSAVRMEYRCANYSKPEPYNDDQARKTFKTFNVPLYNVHDIEESVENSIKKVCRQEEEMAMKGSGRTLESVDNLQLRTSGYSPVNT
ncbi:hypothetical protein PR048_014775 [Dryococelus australis]|uniref:Uncharacterized protein n=1 Tax=Dryococelus australis TaxID=614101 RepID=A0ABQ9HFJ2_9NEOP|nr:hypothetical protein PR048_014775 [Dryococelus australis]